MGTLDHGKKQKYPFYYRTTREPRRLALCDVLHTSTTWVSAPNCSSSSSPTVSMGAWEQECASSTGRLETPESSIFGLLYPPRLFLLLALRFNPLVAPGMTSEALVSLSPWLPVVTSVFSSPHLQLPSTMSAPEYSTFTGW